MSRFELEERYVVIKRSKLSEEQANLLYELMDEESIRSIDCLVIESDWPEYEPTLNELSCRVNREGLYIAEVHQ